MPAVYHIIDKNIVLLPYHYYTYRGFPFFEEAQSLTMCVCMCVYVSACVYGVSVYVSVYALSNFLFRLAAITKMWMK